MLKVREQEKSKTSRHRSKYIRGLPRVQDALIGGAGGVGKLKFGSWGRGMAGQWRGW